MTETLKPCPFCGGKAEIKNNHIECPECIKNFNSIKSKEQLVNFWNTRKSLTLDEIREVLANNSFKLNFLSCDGCELENEDCGNSEDCFKVESLMQEFEKACKASNLVEFIEKEGGK